LFILGGVGRSLPPTSNVYVKQTCNITGGLETHTDINATKKRSQIQMNNGQSNLDETFLESMKKTRGITLGLRANAIVEATNKRILIEMDEEQKLPKTIEANAMFASEIGSFTRKHTPLEIKRWKDVSNSVKTSIKNSISVSSIICYFFNINFCLIY
jgi:ABC-type sulfate transport system substrate-binding protein